MFLHSLNSQFKPSITTLPQFNSFNNKNQAYQIQQNQLKIIQPKFAKNVKKICRICLQTDQNGSQTTHQSKKDYSEQKKYHLNIIQLPCSCKGELGMIHDNCIKFWIKIWLQSKIKDHRDGSIRLRHPRQVADVEVQQQQLQGQPELNVDLNQGLKNVAENRELIKVLDFQKIKQDTIYPFVCQVCHSQFYFNLIFNRRLKAYFQIKKKQLALFIVSLLFAMIFLGICINWYFQSGINIYLIVFFILCWIPMTSITIAAGTWTFTKRQLWIKQIYSKSDLQKLRGKKGKKSLQEKENQKKIREITEQKLKKVDLIKNILKGENENQKNSNKFRKYWSKLNFLDRNSQKQNNKNGCMRTTQNLKKEELQNNCKEEDIIIQIELQPYQNPSPSANQTKKTLVSLSNPQNL